MCVKKHLWEHSLYWDLFDGLNKQQRVLSIQAAIILSIKSNPSLSALLVTSPASSKKKEKKDNVSKMTSKSPTRKDFVNENRKRKRKHLKHTSVNHESDYKPNFGYTLNNVYTLCKFILVVGQIPLFVNSRNNYQEV